jgi:hypothetical protein
MPANFNHLIQRAQLADNDFVDWQSPGINEQDGISSLFANNKFTSPAGIKAVVEEPDLIFSIQGSTWVGNFFNNDALIYSGTNIGPLFIKLNQPVSAVGLHIQINDLGPFIGVLSAYDSAGKKADNVGYCRRIGSSDNATGNALFLGVEDPNASIKYLRVETRLPDAPAASDNEPGLPFAINKLLLKV